MCVYAVYILTQSVAFRYFTILQGADIIMTSIENLRICPMCGRTFPIQNPSDDFLAVFLNFSAQNPMTIRERRELRKWVKFSNNPLCNPWGVCDENGYEINFLDAYRIILDHEIDNYPEYDVPCDSKGEGDLPF